MLVFGVAELARLAEHAVVDADLADVVEQAREIERFQLFSVDSPIRRPVRRQC